MNQDEKKQQHKDWVINKYKQLEKNVSYKIPEHISLS